MDSKKVISISIMTMIGILIMSIVVYLIIGHEAENKRLDNNFRQSNKINSQDDNSSVENKSDNSEDDKKIQ